MPDKKEWTLMFYFASDNPLAPGVVSQLKALKSAGYHPDVNVVTQFDPFVEGTPTHVFEVNLMNKLKHPGVADVGFLGNDPFVRNLVEDKLWREQKTRNDRKLKRELKRILKQNHGINYEAATPPEERTAFRQTSFNDPVEPGPKESLRRFLSFCRDRYPANHFALFILGHGVVVGNDVFLFDEHGAEHTISLTDLGEVLKEFKADIDEAEFELVSFHSCSVSSLEVAFELQETANYMLASQGPAFVGSWPYRSILIRIFNDVIRFGSHVQPKKMFRKIFRLCFFNAVDFLMAGYSFQLTLLDLKRVECVKDAIATLVEELIAGLAGEDPLAKDVILLSHLKSQSFYQEMYTDIYDFCFCITQKWRQLGEPASLATLATACGGVMEVLRKEHPTAPLPPHKKPWERFIVSAEFLGPSYQYSRGISVYFPWTRPVGDRRIMAEYAHYRFHTDFVNTKPWDQSELSEPSEPSPSGKSWLDFLDTYFKQTVRRASSDECDPRRFPTGCEDITPLPKPSEPDICADPNQQTAPTVEPPVSDDERRRREQQEEQELKEDIANLIYGEDLYGDYELAQGDKTGPRDPAGGINSCDCPSIKNYPRDTRPRRERAEEAPEKPRADFTQAKFL